MKKRNNSHVHFILKFLAGILLRAPVKKYWEMDWKLVVSYFTVKSMMHVNGSFRSRCHCKES